MAQRIWVCLEEVRDGKINDNANVYLTPADDDPEFLALTMAEVAELRDVMRNPERCGPCLGSGRVVAADGCAVACAECSGTGLGPRARKVLEMLK